jgi:anti-sigma regulatory factor (Ser/Thr protein kinase)
LIRISTSVGVNESSQVAEARRVTTQCAEQLRLGSTVVARAGLVATELATNLIKHGRGGSLLIGNAEQDEPDAVVIVAIDKGPGMANVESAMQDGYSTAGSPGTGLGAVSRATTLLEVFSDQGKGTVVACRIEADSPSGYPLPSPANTFSLAGICLPKRGETEIGDNWSADLGRDTALIAVIDGLGHGPQAAMASAAGVRSFRERSGPSLEMLLQDMHGALRPTRGAAVGVMLVDLERAVVEFAGVGNIAATIATDKAARRAVSLPGIIGHEMRRVQTFTYPWQQDATLVMYSDGLSGNWNLSDYPGLAPRSPLVIAAVLYRDFCRGNDDVTVLVLKS